MKLMYIFLAAFLCAAVSCGKDGRAGAKKNTATIVYLVGDVLIERNGASVDAGMNAIVETGAMIKTGKNSECNVLISPDSYILVKENSKLSIESLIKETDTISKNSVDLKIGKIAVNPGKLIKGSEFRVKTTYAVAAVRGTRFTVSNNDGKSARISVVEGKVELKPRVEALENENQSSEIVNELSKKLDSRAVVISENQSGEIRSETAVKLNNEIISAISEYNAADDSKKEDLIVKKVSASVESFPVVTADKVSPDSLKDIEQLSQMIVEDKKVREKESVQNATLNIVLPLQAKQVEILMNGKRSGRGSTALKTPVDVDLKIEINAKGFEPYAEKLKLSRGEVRTLEVELVRNKLLDRMEWNNPSGTVKGEIVLSSGIIISVNSTGKVSAMRGDGSAVWSRSLGCTVDSSPIVKNGAAYISGNDGQMYAVDVSTGALLWKIKTGGTLTFGAAPCFDGGTIVAAFSNGKIKAFSKDGKELWITDIKAGIYSSPYAADGVVYVGAEDMTLYAINLRDGSIRWKGALDGRVVSSSPAVYNDLVFVGTFKGSVYALKISDGSFEWRFKTGGAVVSSPVIYKGNLYIGSKDHVMYALNPEKGTPVWKIRVNAPVSVSAVFEGNSLFIAAEQTVYAYDISERSQIWTFDMPAAAGSLAAGNGRIFVSGNNGVSGLRMDVRDVIKK